MTRRIFAITFVLVMAGLVLAQGQKSVKITGYLLDNACGGGGKETDEQKAERAKGHETSCALMPNCAKSGFGVYSDGKYYKFDDAGNKSAKGLLEDTQTKKGVKVEVEGTLDGSTIKVTKLTEVTEAAS
jgi:hypothetical protein